MKDEPGYLLGGDSSEFLTKDMSKDVINEWNFDIGAPNNKFRAMDNFFTYREVNRGTIFMGDTSSPKTIDVAPFKFQCLTK